jgi:two-component system response regulator DevR
MTAKGSIRVVVVDDHDMVRRGLATFLKSQVDLELVGEASVRQRRRAKMPCACVSRPDRMWC